MVWKEVNSRVYCVHLIVDPPPNGVDFYIHRAGRTGRKGQPGKAIILYSDSDRFFMKEVCKVRYTYTVHYVGTFRNVVVSAHFPFSSDILILMRCNCDDWSFKRSSN